MKIGTKEYYIEQSKRCEEKSNKYLKLKDSNNTWEKCGDNLICQNYHGFYFGLFGEKKPSCVISCPITDSMTYKVTTEDMIDENTVFVT